MKQGQEIHFTNLSSPLEVKTLNDAVNYVLNVLSSRFDLSSKLADHVFCKNVYIQPAETKTVEFDKIFAEDPAISVCSEGGLKIIVSHTSGTSDYKEGFDVKFSDNTKQGTVFITVTGKILLKE